MSVSGVSGHLGRKPSEEGSFRFDGKQVGNVPVTNVCLDRLAEHLNVKVQSLTRKLANRDAVLPSQVDPPTSDQLGPRKSPTAAEAVLERPTQSPTSDFTLGSGSDHPNTEYAINQSAERDDLDFDEDTLSINSGPEVLFPGQDDGLGWFEIPRLEDENDTDELPNQPLLDREARLPPSANAVLGSATGAIGSWLQHAVPQVQSRTRMCIAQDSTGATYSTVWDTRTKAKATTKPLKKKLHLPSLPCEVSGIKLFQDAADSRIVLMVYLNRPWLAFMALIVTMIVECINTYIHMRELRLAESDRASVFKSTDICVVQVWLMEGMIVLALLTCGVAWVLGDFSDGSTSRYLRSRYGVFHSLMLMISFGLYLVPWTKHTAGTGAVNIMYVVPPVLVCLANFVTTERVLIRGIVGILLLLFGFIPGMWLPDGITDSNYESKSTWWTWTSITLGAIGLSLCVWCAKQSKPHMPLPLLILLMSVGGLIGQFIFAASSDIYDDPATSHIFTLFLGFSASDGLLEYLGLLSLNFISMACWCWSAGYLSPISIVSVLVVQRLIAICALSLIHRTDATPSHFICIFPIVVVCAAIFAIFDADRRDVEKRVELQENLRNNYITSSTHTAGFSYKTRSIDDRTMRSLLDG
eukprot:TRINITY_DN2331_c0_g1_i4.p1 TRINITY_DN2331_c0_g1~~TRINITY_DN2331_c0_g1_i4.p1  ORF type:complete len:639 (+),score=81.56 TRINITY_DN2331_c0_g1_i4:70-1986(+)